MNWYEKLSKYFPIEEMKSKKHMELLLKEKADVYFKDESEDYVLMYAEFDHFLFIDYVYVSAKTRGKGVGGKLIDKLKAKNKPILLEVEPIQYEDSDSEKRLRFYEKQGFQHAQSIGYNRRSLATNEENPMEILFWAPNNESEEEIYQAMREMYEQIHTYKDKDLYGKAYQEADEVLTFEKDAAKDSIFHTLKENKK
ncbi:Acetyltransferase (GNAT) domain-containing protein [Terribacillus aidingensis]|uniref:Acetyltransferase (GNAT) domain-containing protein n=1 Tax=Terribacillus aidingensis TaxID=586416 RepID=A0A285NXT1_9BACI|nr:GNAT family N-acetyltransferase [Terribacillus aidingensis]SNZ14292.1 Acetyltransferase (GNAT) domain-containing protein [Terribacillus aidingensis]